MGHILFGRWPWHFSFDGYLLTVCTPWIGMQVSVGGVDLREYRKWDGLVIVRRIKGTEGMTKADGRQVFADCFKYEAKRESEFERRSYAGF